MGVVPGVESRLAIDFAAITAAFAQIRGCNVTFVIRLQKGSKAASKAEYSEFFPDTALRRMEKVQQGVSNGFSRRFVLWSRFHSFTRFCCVPRG